MGGFSSSQSSPPGNCNLVTDYSTFLARGLEGGEGREEERRREDRGGRGEIGRRVQRGGRVETEDK